MLTTLLALSNSSHDVRVTFATIDGETVRPLYPLYIGGADEAAFKRAVDDGIVSGEGHDINVLTTAGDKLLVVNVGKVSDLTPDDLRHAAGYACGWLRTHKKFARQAAVLVSGQDDWKFGNDIQLLVEGWGLRNDTVKRSDKGRSGETDVQLVIMAASRKDDDGIEDQITLGDRIAMLGRWTRQVGNLRGSECPPQVLVQRAFDLIREQLGDKVQFPYGEALDVDFYEGQTVGNKTRFGSFLSVNKGSPHKPAGMYAVYDPGIPGQQTLAFVLKAVTFDTGGFLRKPDAAMNDMFMDKHGAVLGIAEFVLLVLQGVPFKLILSFNATENRDGTLGRDIITSRVGQEIEVNHTDAEGRLTLVDGIDFATEMDKPDLIIDLATLTGAAVAALGGQVAMFSTDTDPLMRDVYDAIATSGLGFFPMPINGRQGGKLLRAAEADIVNTDLKKVYGAGSAAWFLAQSLALSNAKHGANTKLWHLDIAGMMDLKAPEGYQLAGADPGAFIGLAHGLLRLISQGWMAAQIAA